MHLVGQTILIVGAGRIGRAVALALGADAVGVGTAALSAADRRMLWVPPGFAHGFLALSEYAEFLYKTTDYWFPAHERTLLWSDPALGIEVIAPPKRAPQ